MLVFLQNLSIALSLLSVGLSINIFLHEKHSNDLNYHSSDTSLIIKRKDKNKIYVKYHLKEYGIECKDMIGLYKTNDIVDLTVHSIYTKNGKLKNRFLTFD